ncbi:hypothetical protein [Micromonospora sp. NPDC001898]|uniref:hypothetical protein n=1 Tax=Micromonospora sp. NPDC001898 TaxID=3364221 RepID=UPI00368DD797
MSTVAAAAGVDATAAAATPAITAATPTAANRSNHPRRRDGSAIDGDLLKADMILLLITKSQTVYPKMGAPRRVAGRRR